jgi:hypothetical protein
LLQLWSENGPELIAAGQRFDPNHVRQREHKKEQLDEVRMLHLLRHFGDE